MNGTELLATLQAQQDKATARAGELRDRIENLTAGLAEADARLAELVTARKVIAELAPAGHEPDPPQQATTYQTIVNAFNQHPDQTFRVRELHELLGMPTGDPAVNVARSRLGRLTRQGFLTQPGRGRYKKRTQRPLRRFVSGAADGAAASGVEAEGDRSRDRGCGR
ncbi:hypothetical protein [Streptomyces brevispora]|uniref:Uncharacterized protein n=1 Tax=Streptomyces brevispora TaxID=887462 RepID=A0A561TUK2_9ACTN|nr:hypothetical protein [Streptomyces brevispora]TWF90792.1 hypothetical protein FHX80_13208 [Streptomyces brevispora]